MVLPLAWNECMFNTVGGDMLIKLEGFAYRHVDIACNLNCALQNYTKEMLKPSDQSWHH